MKDLKIIVRYSGTRKVSDGPTLLGRRDEVHVIKILLGFVGEPGVRAFEHLEQAHLPAMLYPEDSDSQIAYVLAAAIRAAGTYFGELTIPPREVTP